MLKIFADKKKSHFDFLKTKMNLLNYSDYLKINNIYTRKAAKINSLTDKFTPTQQSYLKNSTRQIERGLTSFFHRHLTLTPINKFTVFSAWKSLHTKNLKIKSLVIKKNHQLCNGPLLTSPQLSNSELQTPQIDTRITPLAFNHWLSVTQKTNAHKDLKNSTLHLLVKKNKIKLIRTKNSLLQEQNRQESEENIQNAIDYKKKKVLMVILCKKFRKR